jgi:hypothetical protein
MVEVEDVQQMQVLRESAQATPNLLRGVSADLDAREDNMEHALRRELLGAQQQLQSCEKQLQHVTQALKEQQQTAESLSQSLRLQVHAQAQHRPSLPLQPVVALIKRHAYVQTESSLSRPLPDSPALSHVLPRSPSRSLPLPLSPSSSSSPFRSLPPVITREAGEDGYSDPQPLSRTHSAPHAHAEAQSMLSPRQQAIITGNNTLAPRTLNTLPSDSKRSPASQQPVPIDGNAHGGGLQQLFAQGLAADCVIISDGAVVSRIASSSNALSAAQNQHGGRPSSNVTSISADSQHQHDTFDDLSTNPSRVCTPVSSSQVASLVCDLSHFCFARARSRFPSHHSILVGMQTCTHTRK